MSASWMPCFDGWGWNVRDGAEKVQIASELHRLFGVTVPATAASLQRTEGEERFSRKLGHARELRGPGWVASWQVTSATPCLLWLRPTQSDAGGGGRGSCLLVERRRREHKAYPGPASAGAHAAYPRMTHVHLDVADEALFAEAEVRGTLIEGEVVRVRSAPGQGDVPPRHAFLADDLLSDCGFRTACGGGEGRAYGQRLLRLQDILSSGIRSRPATDAFTPLVRPVFEPRARLGAALSAIACGACRLDYGGLGGVPVGVTFRRLDEATRRRVVYRVPHWKLAHNNNNNNRRPASNGVARRTFDAEAEEEDFFCAWSDDDERADVVDEQDDDGEEGSTSRPDVTRAAHGSRAATFFVRATVTVDVYELFGSLPEMRDTPENSGMAAVAAVPSMQDAAALRQAAARSQAVNFSSHPDRHGGRWTVDHDA